ncbi:MAG: TetR/AcrR family transcriptional regulator [Actinomycetota bacterium]|nr:TetR/AcrR family transcriptional regulator [Actinomycetota bacterium]
MPIPAEHEDPRRARSRARVLAAAVELLRDEGAAGMTIEAVAQRSGVAKTTIYRQFADRDEMHLAAVQSVASQVGVPHSGDLLADVGEFCVALDRLLRAGDFGALLPTVLDGAERSQSLAGMLREIGELRRQALVDRLRAGQREGVLVASADIDVLTSQLIGPIFFRRFISRQATGPAYVRRHVGAVLTPLACATCAEPARGAPLRSAR